jgi:hypothetical protein
MCRLPIASHFLLLWAGQCRKSCLRAGLAQLANAMGWKNMCKGEEVEFLCHGQRSKRAWWGCKSAEYSGHLLHGMKKRGVRSGINLTVFCNREGPECNQSDPTCRTWCMVCEESCDAEIREVRKRVNNGVGARSAYRSSWDI